MQTDDRTPAHEGEGLAVAGDARDRVDWAALVVMAFLAAVCCFPLASAGWFASHEDIRPIARALAAYQEIAHGDPYPRWITEAYLGKGVPLFNFYPPAFSLFVAYAHLLGVPLLVAAKLTVFLLFVVGSLGVYLWVRPHLGSHPALVAGILYLFAPYHFVDLYVRGATAEFTSIAALPFLFVAMDLLVERASLRGFALLAFSSAAVVLSHFLGALMIAPFAAAYALARARTSVARWAALPRIAAGTVVGAALSAFYWLPALAERDALSPVRMQRAVSGYYSPFLHFVHTEQWFDLAWGFGASAQDGFADGMSFQIGLVLVASVAASALLSILMSKGGRGFILLVLGLGIAALLLTSAATRPLYSWFRPLQMVQFPWRFLGPATLFLAAGGAGFASVLSSRRRWVGPGLAATWAALAVALSASHRSVERVLPVRDDDSAIEEAIARDPWAANFGNVDEFLPRDATEEAANTRLAGAGPSGLGVEVGSVNASRSEVTFEVTSPGGKGIAVVPWHAFPGWKVSVDGREEQLVPGPDGLIAFIVPQGRHVARVHFGTTPPRVAGWLLCVLALAILGALAVRARALGGARSPASSRPTRGRRQRR